MKTDLSILLGKEMDRRDFLKHVGVGLVALTGIGTLLKTMSESSPKRTRNSYGASSYGGLRPIVRR